MKSKNELSLKFNSLSEEHLEQVRLWRMSEDVTKFMYTDPIITAQSQRKWFDSIKNDSTNKNWAVSITMDGIDINVAFVNLKIDMTNNRGFWAYYIGDSKYQGMGIGKSIEINLMRYVFDFLNLNKLVCEVFVFNDKVIKIHEKYGSKIEGTLREHIYKNGVYHDIVTMAILKSEWENIKNNFSVINQVSL